MVGSSACKPISGARHTDLGQAGAIGALPGDKGCPAGRTALLAVRIGEAHPFVGNTVDVGRAVAHQPVAVTAQIGNADVITPDDQNVRLFPGFTVRCGEKPILGTFPMAGKTHLAVAAVTRQPVQLVATEFFLPIGAGQFGHQRLKDVAQQILGLDEVVAGI
jgi:hypothetical protein